MEKLVEDLIERFEATRKGIVDQLKHGPVDPNDKVYLLLTGELLAYDACLRELERMLDYIRKNKTEQVFKPGKPGLDILRLHL